jgi:hypothetical protein
MSVGVTYGLGKRTEDIIRLELDYSKAILWEAVSQGICVVSAVFQELDTDSD